MWRFFDFGKLAICLGPLKERKNVVFQPLMASYRTDHATPRTGRAWLFPPNLLSLAPSLNLPWLPRKLQPCEVSVAASHPTLGRVLGAADRHPNSEVGAKRRLNSTSKVNKWRRKNPEKKPFLAARILDHFWAKMFNSETTSFHYFFPRILNL